MEMLDGTIVTTSAPKIAGSLHVDRPAGGQGRWAGPDDLARADAAVRRARRRVRRGRGRPLVISPR
jgi:hypothetical protein